MSVRHVADKIQRNQKIHRQPRLWANAPPINGPILGAVVILVGSDHVMRSHQARALTYPKDRAATYEPLSAGAPISATTPYAIEKAPDIFM
jgi:hypothetical protein